MKYPKGEVYRDLYQRYFQRTPADLLAGIPLKKQYVLDLCGGDGRLTRYVIEQGGYPFYVDQEPDMLSEDLKQCGLEHLNLSVAEATEELLYAGGDYKFADHFDLVACQQGINYWFSDYMITRVRQLLKPGGQFVFNTFNTKPSQVPTVREYKLESEYTLESRAFVEVSYMVGDTIHHVQTREGIPPHVTQFLWISPDAFWTVLRKEFSRVSEERIGPTSIWRCVK